MNRHLKCNVSKKTPVLSITVKGTSISLVAQAETPAVIPVFFSFYPALPPTDQQILMAFPLKCIWNPATSHLLYGYRLNP